MIKLRYSILCVTASIGIALAGSADCVPEPKSTDNLPYYKALHGFLPCSQHYYASVGLGANILVLHDQYRYVPGLNGWPQDTYHASGVTAAEFFSLNTGITFRAFRKYIPVYSLGLEYGYAASPAKIQGTLREYNGINFENYQFTLRNSRHWLLAISKFDLYYKNHIMPYIELGVGASLDTIYGYQEQAFVNVQPRVSPNFSDKSRVGFTFAAGLGLDFLLSKAIWLQFGYRFNTSDSLKTGGGTDAYSVNHLSFHAHIHQVFIKASYLI